ncbi:MAG: NosD domain-containing protein [Methanobacteriota archaeon]
MRKCVAIAVGLLVTLSGAIVVIEPLGESGATPAGKWTAYVAHAPIRIDSNADFNAAHGVSTGNGTSSNPWIIENWEISGEESGYCMYIGNTTDCFTVRGCHLHDAYGIGITPYFLDSGLILFNARNGTIMNNTASSNDNAGFHIVGSSNSVVVADNTAIYNIEGIIIESSSGVTLMGNNVSSNYDDGIYTYEASGNFIINNTAINTFNGIHIVSSDDNIITGNAVSSSSDGIGIYFELSGGNMLSDNTANSSLYGIYLDSSNGNILENNTANSNYEDGIYVFESIGNVISDNIASLNGWSGICLFFNSDNNTMIRNVVFSNEECGIEIDSSASNKVFKNSATLNHYFGIYLDAASDFVLANNTVSSNDGCGIYVIDSTGGTIENNIVSNNPEGVHASYSDGNTIYHNNFIDNMNQAYDNTGTNLWDNGYPSGGNYWSDYAGADILSGPGQNISGSDGISDTPNTDIQGGAGAQDNYPLMSMLTPSPSEPVPHAPIRIDSNAEFDVAHGVSAGNGTTSNPWIIENWDIDGAGYGACIYVGNTTDCFVMRGCRLHDASGYGTWPFHSDSGLILFNVNNGIVTDNEMRGNEGCGIYLSLSNDIMVANNTASYNMWGIILESSNDNILHNNTVFSSYDYGIALVGCDGDVIYHNNIINNVIQALDDGVNLWNSSYPIGGNYWSDYIGDDDFSGPNQDILGSDGIGDIPYTYVEGGIAQDNYPMYHPIKNNGPLPHQPIRINSDSEFDLAHGVISGAGTIADPWVIGGWEINGTGYGYCIYIGNTTNHFVISNCTLHEASGVGIPLYNPDSGITFYNVHNGTIYGNTASSNNEFGIYLYNSDSNVIANNTASNNSCGISLYSSSNNTVVNNAASSNNHYGIYVDISSGNSIRNNTIAGNSDHDEQMYIDEPIWQECESDLDEQNNATTWEEYVYSYRLASYQRVVSIINNPSYTVHIVGDQMDDLDLAIYYDLDFDGIIDPGERIRDGEIMGAVSYAKWSMGGYALCADDDSNEAIKLINPPNGQYIIAVYGWNVVTGSVEGQGPPGKFQLCTATELSMYGIYTQDSDLTISGNNVTGFFIGIYGTDMTNSFISDNSVSEASFGLYQSQSSLSQVSGNLVQFCDCGIYLDSSSSDTITHNTVSSNNIYGIYLGSSISATIVSNTASNNGYGIYLGSSTGATIASNDASNNECGIYLYSSTSNDIIYNTASNGSTGIYLYWYSSGNTVAHNTVLNDTNGIYLYAWCDMNAIANNTVSNNSYGLYLYWDCSSNTLVDNFASDNWYGIYLYTSVGNTVAHNTASSNNGYGIYLSFSNSNTIYHNNFIDNMNQAYDNTGTNLWDNSYPSGGNYWTDFSGIDLFSGPEQNEPGSDGIGDTPYSDIRGGTGALDNYPMMLPWNTSQTPSPTFFRIPVVLGWNLISVPLEIPSLTLPAQFLDGDTQWDRVMWYDSENPQDYWKQFNTAWPWVMNDLTRVETSMGFWINVTDVGDGYLNLTGVVPISTQIQLRTGWNLVGYPTLSTNTTIATAFWGTSADIVEVFDAGAPYMTTTVGPSYIMRPGEGYWVHVVADSVWTVDW